MYDLSNADFSTASLLMNTDVDDRGQITFVTKNGKIDQIIFDNDALHAPLTRDADNKNTFSGMATVVGNEEPEPGAIKYESTAKDKKLGLTYSDFGVFRLGPTHEKYDSDWFFAGGYKAKEIDKTQIVTDITFTGYADGVVRIGDMSSDAKPGDSEALGVNDPDAKLTLFAEMNAGGDLTRLKFSDGDKAGFYSDSDKYDFKWYGDDEHVANETDVVKDTGCGQEDCGSQLIVRDGFVKYCGDNNNPAEAVGTIIYGDSQGYREYNDSGNQIGSDAMRFDMGFGAKRD